MKMLDSALALARQGFDVFPIKEGAKAPPLVSAWQQHATGDEQQIEAWWAQWPNANVGIHCDGMLVIDVDPDKGGYESLDALEKEVQLDATYEVGTPSGGRHIYYRAAADNVRNGVDVFGPGLDVRSKAGYVVGAGSVIGSKNYEVLHDEPLADVDPALVARCGVARPKVERQKDAPALSTDEDAAVARAVAFLRTHAPAVEGPGGGGEFHTYKTACRVRDFGVPQARAREALAEWNARCEPPWEADGLEVKIRNAYRYAQEAAGRLTPEAIGFKPVPGAETVQDSASFMEREQVEVELLHPSDIGLDEVLKAEYHIKGVLEKQSNAVLFGQWNVGKTFVVLDMAASIACGQPWFGKRVRQGRVLYLGYEGIRAMKKRIIALRDKYPLLKKAETPFAWAALRNPLTTSAGNDELVATMAEFKTRHGGNPDLLVIDPLANALGGDDADANLMFQLNRRVAELIRVERCTVLRVHHSGHGNQERARGHSSLPAGVDTEIRVSDGQIALTKQRDDVKSGMSFRRQEVPLGRDSDGDEVKTCVIVQVESNSMSPDLTDPERALLDALLDSCGMGGEVKQKDVKAAAPDATPDERTEIIRTLVRKQFLRAQEKDTGWVLCERGPGSMFDKTGDGKDAV